MTAITAARVTPLGHPSLVQTSAPPHGDSGADDRATIGPQQ
jgi:hypothetical protein